MIKCKVSKNIKKPLYCKRSNTAVELLWKDIKERIMQEDYSKYEGQELLVYNPVDKEYIKAIVAGCEYDIGITIVKKEDKNYRITCLKSNMILKENKWNNVTSYDKIFKVYIDAIKSGFLIQRTFILIDKLLNKYENDSPGTHSAGIPADHCPFSQ